MAKKSSKSKKSSKKQPAQDQMWMWIVAALVVIIVAISWCSSQSTPEVQQDPIPEPEPEPTPIVEEEDVVEEIQEELRQPNPEVTQYFSRQDQVRSFSFIPAVYYKDRGLTETDVRGEFLVYEDKARADLFPVEGMGGWTADTVFIDYSDETAMAYCVDVKSCKDQQKKTRVDFDAYSVPLPKSWIDSVQYGEVTGRVTLNSRTSIVVDWEADGLYWRATVDTYYGIPMRVFGASDPEITDIVTGVDYRGIAFNNVKESDVESPY